MSFADDIHRFTVKVKVRARGAFVGIATEAHRSIKEGSFVTGAPGQPVDTGFLRDSWILDIQPTHADITTNVAYAPVIEHNSRAEYDPSGRVNRYGVTGGLIGPAAPASVGTRRPRKSTIGGHHSVKLTIAGANALQAQVLRELGAA